MNKQEFEALHNVLRQPQPALPGQLTNKSPRTLLYGYTCARNTWHVYLDAEGVQGSRSFTLDATGNCTSTTIGGSAYNYSVNGESNRLATSTAPGSAASYQYDGAGQVLTDGTRYYTWTKGGHLASAEVGVNLTTYAYNGFGQRVKKVTGAGSAAAAKHYLYADDGVSLLGEYLQASAMAQVTATYEVVYLEGIPVLVLSGGQVFYIQSDHLNAPRTVKNAAGAGASVRYVNAGQNRGAGKSVATQCAVGPNGCKVEFLIK